VPRKTQPVPPPQLPDAPARPRIRVCVLSPDKFRRLGLCQVLTRDPELLVLHTEDLHDELEIVTRFRPDVVVLDTPPRAPEVPAFIQACRHVSPQTQVLLVGTDSTTDVSPFRAGVKGYLDILHFPDEIPNAIKALHRGHAWIARRLVGRLIDEIAAELEGPRPGRSSVLTPAQRRVLQLLAREGLTNKEIAARLAIEERTVEYHITKLLQRFRIGNRNQLIIYTLTRKILST